ncbi:hypothetical protein E4U30_005122 [Claviceps sp. LM220 group G6]|nr:hypothetical protein E4U31_008160 [Claviceps sp. LM219 group G6]KAG6092672.1 hypothetical protein E4U30_005122 [Claviceps sp. LM220 group G6]
MSASRSMNTRSMSHNIEGANPFIIENDPVQTEMQQQTSLQDNPIQQDLAGNNEDTETTVENQEATLSRSIAEAEAKLRIIEKRKKLEQLEQSLQFEHTTSEDNLQQKPTFTPHDLDSPAPTPHVLQAQTVAPAPQRYSLAKAQLRTPIYKGDTYENLQNFLADLNVAFTLDRHAFDIDATKVAFASSCLQDDAKRQWMRYAATDGYVDYQAYSWVEFVSWLKTGGMDFNSRRLEAMGVLLNLRQGKNESLHSFIKSWGKAEAEYPEPFPDSLRTVWFMQSLNSDMKQQVFRQEHPENFNHLMGLMKKAESAVDATKNENEEGTLSTLHVERG